MKVILLIGFICFVGCVQENKESETDYSGNWVYVNNTVNRDFSISLQIESDTLKGEHCFVANKGSKIDCSDEGFSSIICVRKGSMYSGYFNSTYTNKKYILEMHTIGDTLHWKLENYDQLFFSNDLKFVKKD